jgi:hypothetical protein
MSKLKEGMNQQVNEETGYESSSIEREILKTNKSWE